MRKTIWVRLIPAVLASAMILAGCAGVSKPAPGSAAVTASAPASQKPPLDIPKTFTSDSAKMSFAVQAVDKGYYKEALPLLEQAVAKNPDATGYQRLGTARYNLSDYKGAIEAWSKAAEIDPRLASEMQNNVGNALRDQKLNKDAEAAYRKALTLEPSRSSAAINLAVLLKEQGNLKDAITVLETATRNNAKDTSLPSMLDSYKKDAGASAKG